MILALLCLVKVLIYSLDQVSCFNKTFNEEVLDQENHCVIGHCVCLCGGMV
jgi:hypothetical protein